MPVTLKCIIEKNNVDENVAKFMLPIGSAINMDGTALYEGEFIENLSINDGAAGGVTCYHSLAINSTMRFTILLSYYKQPWQLYS